MAHDSGRFSKEELREGLRAIRSTLGKCEKVLPKLRRGTSQHTLLARRIEALCIASTLMERELEPRSRGRRGVPGGPMRLTNDRYVILLGTRRFTERYYRDRDGWLKVSARGRTFRMTAEQVLNHVLPALAGLKPGVTVTVEHHG